MRDTHSLEFEVAAELGLVGLLALALMCGGVAVAARRALAAPPRRSPPAPAAALVVWFLHASIDWDWQMPAVTLPALVLAGLLITQAEGGGRRRRMISAERVEAPVLGRHAPRERRVLARVDPPERRPGAEVVRLRGDDVLHSAPRVAPPGP